MSYRFLVVVAIFVSIAGCGSSDEVASSWQVPDLSIGVPDLKQDVVKRDVVEGVEFYDILRGEFGGILIFYPVAFLILQLSVNTWPC